MAFNCSVGNMQRNLYIDHSVSGQPDRTVAIALPDFAGDRTLFFHEHAASFCACLPPHWSPWTCWCRPCETTTSANRFRPPDTIR